MAKFRDARLVPPPPRAHVAAMLDRSPLEDPRNAAHAWRRFRGLMKLVITITALAVVGAMLFIYSQTGFESVSLYIAAALGVAFSMLLTGALMGLVFLSSGTGHDQSVKDATSSAWYPQDDD